MRVLLRFSQAHEDFRVAEWRSVCALSGLHEYTAALDRSSTSSALAVVEIADETHVRRLCKRLVLLKSAYEILHDNDDHKANCHWVTEKSMLIRELDDRNASWRLQFKAVGKRRSTEYVKAQIATYAEAFTTQNAPVNLHTPDNEFTIVEDSSREGTLRRVYLTCLLCDAQSALKTRYSLKTRRYIGNSTMDPELAFLQANLSGVVNGALVCDPFCGTGGLLLAAAHFGALVVGTEINWMVARAKGRSSRQGEGDLRADRHSLASNFAQYETSAQFLGVLIADASRSSLWCCEQGLFDAIVADPPYGVREKGRKVGPKERKLEKTEQLREDGVPRYPEKVKYGLTNTYLDLMDFAARCLTVNGSLSYWFPILCENYSPSTSLPQHPCLELVHNCEQPLTLKTSRRLLVFRKTRQPTGNADVATVPLDSFKELSFREAIFGVF